MLIDENALAESTDVELTFAEDSDATIPVIGSQEETPYSHQEEPTVHASEVQLEETLTVIRHQTDPVPERRQQQRIVTSEERPVASQRGAGRTGSRTSDYEGVSSVTTGSRNTRNKAIQDEFSLREEKYKRAQAREEELHQLKIQEQMWLVKESLYKKNELEREAEEIRLNKLKNE